MAMSLKKTQKEILPVNTAQQGAQDKIRFYESEILAFKNHILRLFPVKVNLTMVAGSREARQNLGINNSYNHLS